MFMLQREEYPLTVMDSVLSLNVRGANLASKQKIKQFIVANKCGLVGLLETTVKSHNMGKLYLVVEGTLSISIYSPWIVFRDFNYVLEAEERIEALVCWNEMANFRACIDDCDLADMKYSVMKGILIVCILHVYPEQQMGKKPFSPRNILLGTSGDNKIPANAAVIQTGVIYGAGFPSDYSFYSG
uniref:Uncharacterized protein n=1 Tax=Chenopodium quinoa TaxID=63459 RepID=A0A803N0H7_CHEQI